MYETNGSRSSTATMLALVPLASAVTYKFAPINVPGAKSTVANGINNANVIVGSYVTSGGKNLGFRYQGGRFTTINFPGSTQTFANGINDLGDIVGTYSAPTTPSNPANTHGFVLHNGTYRSITCPGSNFTAALGINKSGTIVGGCETSSGDLGFVFSGGKFSFFNAPTVGSPDTQLNGIANTGQIAGQVFSADNQRGFLKVGSDLDFLKPIQSLDNMAMGVNGHGDVVGCYNGGVAFLAYNPEAGETESSEKFPVLHTVAPGGSHGSCAMGITYTRSIVGWYYDASFHQHGFYAIPQ